MNKTARHGKPLPTRAELIAASHMPSLGTTDAELHRIYVPEPHGCIINELKLIQSYLCWSYDHSMRIEHAIRYLEFTNELITLIEKARKERGLSGVIDVTEIAVICKPVTF